MTRVSEKMSAISFDRSFRQSSDAVFAAFSREELKGKWFTGPSDARIRERMLDCRIGGHEVLEVLWASGTVTRFEARYHAVEPEKRLVYSYDLFIDGVLYSVSLADILFSRGGSGTAVNFTETTTYFSDQDLGEMTASRLHGTKAQFDMLASALAGENVVSTIDDCH
jgi:uncharacterized protein YndB with AHSA1/START domain